MKTSWDTRALVCVQKRPTRSPSELGHIWLAGTHATQSKSTKAGTPENSANSWWNLSSGADFIIHSHVAFLLILTWLTPTNKRVAGTLIIKRIHEVIVDPWLFGLSCYYNDCTGGHSKHTWQHDEGAQLPFPQESEWMFVSQIKSLAEEQRGKVKMEKQSSCMYVIQTWQAHQSSVAF